MNIIEQSKAEALRKDNNTRMNNAVKNIDFYYNNQYEYTKEEMQKRNPDWKKSFQDRLKSKKEILPQIMENLNPSNYEIIDDESGFWVYFVR